MTQIIWTVLVLFIGGVLGVCLGPRYRTNAPVAVTAPVIGRITELADLVVLRVPVSKVHISRIGGYVGGVDCVVLINGELEVGTDLKLARFEEVNPESSTATLKLAEPLVRRARLDHDQTSVYRIDRKGLWKVVPSAEPSLRVVNQAMIEAQRCMETAGEEILLIERSKLRAEQVINQFFRVMGWEVMLEWEGD